MVHFGKVTELVDKQPQQLHSLAEGQDVFTRQISVFLQRITD